MSLLISGALESFSQGHDKDLSMAHNDASVFGIIRQGVILVVAKIGIYDHWKKRGCPLVKRTTENIFLTICRKEGIMNHRSKRLCVLLLLLVGVFFISSQSYAAAPADDKVGWFAEQIADYLQVVTGETYGESFIDMVTNLLNADFAPGAPWYLAMNKAHQGCGAAEQAPASQHLQDMCEVDTQVAIQEALQVLVGSPGLPPQLVSVFRVAMGETPPAEEEPPAPGAEPEAPILDPQTTEQERYLQDEREASLSQ